MLFSMHMFILTDFLGDEMTKGWTKISQVFFPITQIPRWYYHHITPRSYKHQHKILNILLENILKSIFVEEISTHKKSWLIEHIEKYHARGAATLKNKRPLFCIMRKKTREIPQRCYVMYYPIPHQILLCWLTEGSNVNACGISKRSSIAQNFLIFDVSADCVLGHLVRPREINNWEKKI